MFQTAPENILRMEMLAPLLRELPIRGVLTYAELSEVLGEDVRAHRVILNRVRKDVEEETGLRFATIHGIGIKKLDGEAIPGIGADARKSIRRKARRASRRLTGLSYNDIRPATRRKIDAERSLLGAVEAASRIRPDTVARASLTGPVLPVEVFRIVTDKED